MLSTFYDSCPLKLRKLEAVEKLKVNIERSSLLKLTPNASYIVLVNSLIQIAAKGSALQMQMKDFTHICFFYRQ